MNVRQGVYRKVSVVHVWMNEGCSKMCFEFSGYTRALRSRLGDVSCMFTYFPRYT